MAEVPERVESIDPSASLDDWMIITKNENNENEELQMTGGEHEEDEVEKAEFAENLNEGEIRNNVSDDIETKSADESDISVIEGDYENAIVQQRVSTTLDRSDILQYFERFSNLSQSGITKNVIIVCLLAIIIAMYADRSSNINNTCMFKNNMNFQEDYKILMDHLQPLNLVLTQIKPFISKLNAQNRTKNINDNPSVQQNLNEKSTFNSSNLIPELILQSSLNSLCFILNGVQSANQPVIGNICESRGVIFNLIEFKNVINTSMQEFQQLNNPTINKYLENMDQKFNHLCQSLLDDLSMAVDRLMLKVYNKLNKANSKLNKWVCAVKDNKILYDSLLTSFDKNNITLGKCDEIINSTKYELQKSRNYVEDDYSNVTFDFWRKDKLSKYRERNFDKKKEAKKMNKRKNKNLGNDIEKFWLDMEKNQDNVIPFDYDKLKIPNSPWSAVKSTFKSGKSKKPHKLKVKANKKQKQLEQYTSSSEVFEDQAEEMRNKVERKEPKYKKFGKKERKSGFEEDDLFRININADWQWERNQAREMNRRLQNEASDWYFERANSRKHARKDAFTKK